MKRLVLVVPLIFACSARAEPPPDDVKFHQLLKRTSAAARDLEVARMFEHLARSGANMGPGDGWFRPSESRYSWKWLSERCGNKERISPKDFAGPAELFARLDRDRDGFITASDLDWSPNAPYFRQMSQAQMWMRQRSKDGKLGKAEWDELFKQLSQGKDHLSLDDVRALLNPPPMSMPPRPTGPFDKMPSKALLIQGLLTNEIGSLFEGPRLGQKAPDFTLPTHDGKKFVTLSKYWQLKPVVLIFGSFT